MANNKGDDEDFDAWRIGQKFTVVKFLQPLKDFNDAAKQAKFGIIPGTQLGDVNQMFYTTDNRVMGLEKMHFILDMLSYDIYFSLNTNERKRLSSLKARLSVIEKTLISKNYITQHNNQVSHVNSSIIKEEIFNIIFKTLLDINSKMLDMMNQAGLIFRKNEEFDLDQFMSDIVHRG